MTSLRRCDNPPRVVEGNHYFPPASLRAESFEDSATHTTCSWKGVASYKTVVAGDQRNADAAWYYPDPKPAADEIRGWFAFWRGIVAALLLVGVATFVAGERTEVARLRSFDERGVVHETKLWVVDQPDGAWVRVARPERKWLKRLRKNPEIEIVRHGGAPLKVRATPDLSTDTKVRFDRAFRDKYGIVDWGYGLLLRARLAWLDRDLAKRPFIAGDRYTIADITALCALDFGRVVDIRIAPEQKNLLRWYESVSSRPSAKA